VVLVLVVVVVHFLAVKPATLKQADRNYEPN
jgi:hypothetical protein